MRWPSSTAEPTRRRIRSRTAPAQHPQHVTADNNWDIYRAYDRAFPIGKRRPRTPISNLCPQERRHLTNLVTANTILLVACYADAADTTAVSISGWTTGASQLHQDLHSFLSSEVGTHPAAHRNLGLGGLQAERFYAVCRGTRYSERYLCESHRVADREHLRHDDRGRRQRLWHQQSGWVDGGRIPIQPQHYSGSEWHRGLGGCRNRGIQRRRQSPSVGQHHLWFRWRYLERIHQSRNCGPVQQHHSSNSGDTGIFLQGAGLGNYRVGNNLVQGGTGSDYKLIGSTPDYSATNLSSDATSPQVALRNKTVLFVGAADFHLSPVDVEAKDQARISLRTPYCRCPTTSTRRFAQCGPTSGPTSSLRRGCTAPWATMEAPLWRAAGGPTRSRSRAPPRPSAPRWPTSTSEWATSFNTTRTVRWPSSTAEARADLHGQRQRRQPTHGRRR